MPPAVPIREGASLPPGEIQWVRESSRPEETFRVGRRGSSVIAEWRGLGTLWSSLDGRDVQVLAAPGLDPLYEHKWRRGAVRALVRHLESRPTLHASAVAREGVAVAFLGDSGAGKSTCAAHLCARLGAELLADDLTEVDVDGEFPMVAPSESSHWLFGDSADALGYQASSSGKRGLPSARAAVAPVALGALVALAFGDDFAPSLAALRGVAAFSAINASYTRFIIDDPWMIQRDLHQIADLVAAVPTFILTRPRSFAALDQTAVLVSALVDALRRPPIERSAAR